ncbi:MAG: response regulator [Patescibacteria group bacterium]|jgi:two-component system alkaline phosphatase synthesis response regulator PhoP
MKKVLIVEDETPIRNEYVQAARRAGFDVIEASDGEAAINLAMNEAPDAMVLDIILPKKHGFDVLKEIRADDRTRAIPVIVMSNLAGGDNETKAMSLGAQAYIVKTPGQTQPVIDWLLNKLK